MYVRGKKGLHQGDRMGLFKKSAEKKLNLYIFVKVMYIMHSFCRGKKQSNIWATSVIFKEMPKANNRLY
jgi:hypothetical protein